jgi:hypothetical protein
MKNFQTVKFDDQQLIDAIRRNILNAVISPDKWGFAGGCSYPAESAEIYESELYELD